MMLTMTGNARDNRTQAEGEYRFGLRYRYTMGHRWMLWFRDTRDRDAFRAVMVPFVVDMEEVEP